VPLLRVKGGLRSNRLIRLGESRRGSETRGDGLAWKIVWNAYYLCYCIGRRL